MDCLELVMYFLRSGGLDLAPIYYKMYIYCCQRIFLLYLYLSSFGLSISTSFVLNVLSDMPCMINFGVHLGGNVVVFSLVVTWPSDSPNFCTNYLMNLKVFMDDATWFSYDQ